MMTLRSPWQVFFEIYSQGLMDFGDKRPKLMTNAPEKRFFGVGSDEDMEIISRFLTLAGYDPKRLHYRTKQQFADGVEKKEAHDGLQGGAKSWPIRAPNNLLPRARTL